MPYMYKKADPRPSVFTIQNLNMCFLQQHGL